MEKYNYQGITKIEEQSPEKALPAASCASKMIHYPHQMFLSRRAKLVEFINRKIIFLKLPYA
jgi:hypothetical protein